MNQIIKYLTLIIAIVAVVSSFYNSSQLQKHKQIISMQTEIMLEMNDIAGDIVHELENHNH